MKNTLADYISQMAWYATNLPILFQLQVHGDVQTYLTRQIQYRIWSISKQNTILQIQKVILSSKLQTIYHVTSGLSRWEYVHNLGVNTLFNVEYYIFLFGISSARTCRKDG